MSELVQRVWRYLTFANCTWSDRADAARIRAGWPTWRQAVCPVGASAWWGGAIVGLFTNEYGNLASVALLVIVFLCVTYGIFDGTMTQRARRRAPRPRERPSTGAFFAASKSGGLAR